MKMLFFLKNGSLAFKKALCETAAVLVCYDAADDEAFSMEK